MDSEDDQDREEIEAERDTDATELTVVGAFRFGLASSTASERLGVLRRAGLSRADPGDRLPYEVEG